MNLIKKIVINIGNNINNLKIRIFSKYHKYDKYRDSLWYLSDNRRILVCGIYKSKEDKQFDEVSFFFYNENSNKIVFNNVWKFLINYSIYLYLKDENGKYELFKNNTSRLNPLSIKKLSDMILIVNTLNGMYVYHRNNTRFMPDVAFHRISNDFKRLLCKEHKKRNMNRTIGFQEFPLFENSPYYYKRKKKIFTENPEILPIHIKHIIGDKIDIYFSDDNSRASIIAQEYYKNKLEIIKNEFDDDDTLNFKITLNYNDKKELGFANFLRRKCKNISIYGIEVQTILDVVTNSYIFQKYNYFTDEQNAYLKKTCFEIINKLKLLKKMTIQQTLQYLYDKYVFDSSNNNDFIDTMLKINCCDYSVFKNEWKEKYNILFANLVNEKKINIKWKSEYQLYLIVKKEYNDAIYQYRCDWLGLQSYDIFIPSKKVAIEYQGKQHYEPISIFGGEESLIRQQKLDEKKRKISMEHNIKLIEWKYSEPITKILLKDKLNENIK